MKTAIYARVSTSDQSCEFQLQELRNYCVARGWEIYREYVDHGRSGKSTRKRVAFKELMKDAGSRKFDCVIVLKLDRFGRSIVDLVNSLQMLESSGVRFIAISQGIDTDRSNPMSRFMVHMLSAVAEFERALIVERTQAVVAQYRKDYSSGKIGQERSSKSGKNMPANRPKLVVDRLKILESRGNGLSIRKTAKLFGVSPSFVAGCTKSRLENEAQSVAV